MDLTNAVKNLRRRLGDSQQAFATRLGLSIRAIANYEKDRSPTGKALAALVRVAEEAGYEDLAAVFRAALTLELGITIRGRFESYLKIPRRDDSRKTLLLNTRSVELDLIPQTAAEKLWVAGVLTVLRNAEYVDIQPKLAQLLLGVIKKSVSAITGKASAPPSSNSCAPDLTAPASSHLPAAKQALKLLRHGRSADEVAGLMHPLQPDVRSLQAVRELSQVLEQAKNWEQQQ